MHAEPHLFFQNPAKSGPEKRQIKPTRPLALESFAGFSRISPSLAVRTWGVDIRRQDLISEAGWVNGPLFQQHTNE